MSDTKAQLTINGKDPIDLPVYQGTTGPDVIDVRSLVSKGVFTYDPGFVSTAACDSQITYIDGNAGVLLHRGYPIEQLAENSDFLEVCYLLLNGELPNPDERNIFENEIRYHTMVDQQIHEFFKGFPRNAHPMAMLCGIVGALSAFYHDRLDIDNHESFAKKVRFGKDKRVTTKLKELLANLRVDSSPTGATVYINGSRKGRTPTDIKKIAMSDSLDIKIELKNYIEYEFNFTPIKSGDNYEKVNLERGQGYLRILPASGYSTDKISIKINGKNRGTLRNLTNSYEWNESRKTLTLDAGKNNLEVIYDGDGSVVRKNSVTIVTDETFDDIWEVNFQESVDVTITF